MYFRFCEYYELILFPASEWQLIRFVRYVANGVTSYDTVTGYLSSIRRLHELGGFPLPKEVHWLKLELMAIKRELAHLVKKAPPITPLMLVEMFQHVTASRQDQVAYAALVVGFTLFLRKSNLVPDSINGFNPKEQLTVEDITWKGERMVIDIEWSKTLQVRDRELVLPLIPARNKVVCAVAWIKQILACRAQIRKGDPLFAYEVNGLLIPLTYEVLSKKLKEWVGLMGRQGDLHTLHGLRRGG